MLWSLNWTYLNRPALASSVSKGNGRHGYLLHSLKFITGCFIGEFLWFAIDQKFNGGISDVDVVDIGLIAGIIVGFVFGWCFIFSVSLCNRRLGLMCHLLIRIDGLPISSVICQCSLTTSLSLKYPLATVFCFQRFLAEPLSRLYLLFSKQLSFLSLQKDNLRHCPFVLCQTF